MADTRAFPRHTTTQKRQSERPTMCKYKALRPSPSSSPRLLPLQGQLSSLPPEPTTPTRQIVQAATSIHQPSLTHQRTPALPTQPRIAPPPGPSQQTATTKRCTANTTPTTPPAPTSPPSASTASTPASPPEPVTACLQTVHDRHGGHHRDSWGRVRERVVPCQSAACGLGCGLLLSGRRGTSSAAAEG